MNSVETRQVYVFGEIKTENNRFKNTERYKSIDGVECIDNFQDVELRFLETGPFKDLYINSGKQDIIKKNVNLLIRQGKLNTLPDLFATEKIDSDFGEINNGNRILRDGGFDVFYIPDTNELADSDYLLSIAKQIKEHCYKNEIVCVFFFIHHSTVGNVYNDFGFVEIQKAKEDNDNLGIYAKSFSHTSNYFEKLFLDKMLEDNSISEALKYLSDQMKFISLSAISRKQERLRKQTIRVLCDDSTFYVVGQENNLTKKLNIGIAANGKTSKNEVIVWFHTEEELNQLHDGLKSPGRFTLNFEEIYDAKVIQKGVSATISRKYLPVVHYFDDDIMFEDSKPNFGKRMDYYIPRFKKFFDSSIWNYYLPKNEESFNQRVKVICEDIVSNYNRGLYDLQISHEFIDLQNRLLGESWLPSTDAHSKDVSPFLYHSESEMKEKAEDEKNKLQKRNNYKWRILLIDDYANYKLKKMDGTYSNETKAAILNSVLIRYGFKTGEINVSFEIDDNNKRIPKLTTDNILKDCNIAICKVHNLEDAKCLLNNNEGYSFDIILLDYLLGNRSDGQKGREYGYEFLKELRDNKKDYKIGSCGKYSIMFISAFTTAINERLLSEGITHNNELWHIGEGACPVNTPNRFMYYLLNLMTMKIGEVSSKNKRNKEEKLLTVIDLLRFIYLKEEDNLGFNIRQNAHERFNEVLDMRFRYRKLEDDISTDDKELTADEVWLKKSSVFVKSAFMFIHHFSGAFFEHLQHLVYLTAYGTIRQWEELWEEYLFIKNELKRYDQLIASKGKACDEGKKVSDAIRVYIINLKENSYR